ncbi:hypothetical protein ACQJBY_033637 [Aegilops geniculata]
MHVTATLLCSGLKYPIHDTVICTKLTMMNFGQGNPIVYASSVTEERYLGYSFVMFRLESIYPVCFFFVQFIKVLQERGALLTKKIERGRQLLESEKARTVALEASVSDCISEEQYCEMRRRLSLVCKEANNYQSIAELDALEACSCQELLLKTRDAGDSNQNITSGLQAMVQNERDRGRPAVTNPVRPG